MHHLTWYGVYTSQGVLQDGQVVAIKILFSSHTIEESRLYDEINVFVDLKHKNIIRPLGYCHEIKMSLCRPRGNRKCLGVSTVEFCFVEEYMENSSIHSMVCCSVQILVTVHLWTKHLNFDVTDQ